MRTRAAGFRRNRRTAFRRGARAFTAIDDVRLWLSQCKRAEPIDLNALATVAVQIKDRENKFRQCDRSVAHAVLEGKLKRHCRPSMYSDHAKHTIAPTRLPIRRRCQAAKRLHHRHNEIKRCAIHVPNLGIPQLCSRATVRAEAAEVLNQRSTRCAASCEIQSDTRTACSRDGRRQW